MEGCGLEYVYITINELTLSLPESVNKTLMCVTKLVFLLYKVVLNESYIEHYIRMVLVFIMLCKLVLTLMSVDETLVCDDLKLY